MMYTGEMWGTGDHVKQVWDRSNNEELLKSEAVNQHSSLLGILLADMALEPSDHCSCSESVHLHDYCWRCGSVHVPYKLWSCK